MHPNDAPLISDPIMQALLQMLKTTNEKTSAVHEDALVAIGTLVEGLFNSSSQCIFSLIEFSFGIAFYEIHRSCSSSSLRSIE